MAPEEISRDVDHFSIIHHHFSLFSIIHHHFSMAEILVAQPKPQKAMALSLI